jgi:ubiquinone/menaquinone biosynthesis C-methylase UbiE
MINQKKKYNLVGGFFDFVSGIFERGVINTGIDSLDLKTEDKFLDLACGTGKVMLYAYKKTNNVYGCDFSEKMLDEARKRLSNKKAHIIECDITKKMPYKSNFFDKINFSVTLGMIDEKDYEKMFSEIKRILKQDGLLSVTEYTTKKRNIFTFLLEWENKIFPGFQDCRPIDVEGILKKNGFKVLNYKVKSCFGFNFEVVLAKKK